jgi:hypothetical protein
MPLLFSKCFGKQAGCPTKRAPDKWDSAAFFSSFLASSFFCSQAFSTPAHLRVTITAVVKGFPKIDFL